MWNTHSSLFCFTSRLFATFCYWPVTLPAGGRRRRDGAMRAIKDLCTVSGPRWSQLTVQRYGKLSCPTNFWGSGESWRKKKRKKSTFSPLFGPFGESLVKVRESLVKVLLKTFVRIRREGGGLLKRIRWSLPKKQDATPAPPALDPQNSPPARHRFTGIIQSGHYVIMSSCRYVIMPLRILLENAVYGLKEIVYIIFILYILFLWLLISPFFLTAWWHDDITAWWHFAS